MSGSFKAAHQVSDGEAFATGAEPTPTKQSSLSSTGASSIDVASRTHDRSSSSTPTSATQFDSPTLCCPALTMASSTFASPIISSCFDHEAPGPTVDDADASSEVSRCDESEVV